LANGSGVGVVINTKLALLVTDFVQKHKPIKRGAYIIKI